MYETSSPSNFSFFGKRVVVRKRFNYGVLSEVGMLSRDKTIEALDCNTAEGVSMVFAELFKSLFESDPDKRHTTLLELLPWCTTLRTALFRQTSVDNDFLLHIAELFPNLEALDVSDNGQINNIGIRYLQRLRKLRALGLSNTSVRSDALDGLPNYGTRGFWVCPSELCRRRQSDLVTVSGRGS